MLQYTIFKIYSAVVTGNELSADKWTDVLTVRDAVSSNEQCGVAYTTGHTQHLVIRREDGIQIKLLTVTNNITANVVLNLELYSQQLKFGTRSNLLSLTLHLQAKSFN